LSPLSRYFFHRSTKSLACNPFHLANDSIYFLG